MLVETLITKASKRVGSQKLLAETLGVSETVVSSWKSGARKIQPQDFAAIAYLAGYNAINFLALATLQEAKGTPKEKVLQEALGESIRALESTLLSGSIDKNDHKTQWGITYIYNNLAEVLKRKHLQRGAFSQAKTGLWPYGLSLQPEIL